MIDFFDRYVDGTEKLPLEESLEKVGFSLEEEKIVEIENLSNKQQELRKYWINK